MPIAFGLKINRLVIAPELFDTDDSLNPNRNTIDALALEAPSAASAMFPPIRIIADPFEPLDPIAFGRQTRCVAIAAETVDGAAVFDLILTVNDADP